MTVDHYIAFIGAGVPLATELSSLESRISKSRIIAPVVKRRDIGVTDAAIELAADRLYEELSRDSNPSQVARLYLWMYKPATAEQFGRVWRTFGHASWVETIPRAYFE